MQTIEQFFVLTGGPGSGKSTVIEALGRAGYAHQLEAGRSIIQAQAAIGGRALPWSDRLAYAELMLSWEMRSYEIAQTEMGPVFFDRGVPDVLAYLRVCGVAIPPHMQRAARTFRYNRCVFIAPPWPAIFKQDLERKQDFDEAVRTYEALKATYEDCDYDLIELPRGPVQDRTRFILENAGVAHPV